MDGIILTELPDIVLENILLHLNYDEIAHTRRVSLRINEVCKSLLNKGFIAVENYHSRCLKSIKSQLPRRESERRNHPLSRKADILTAIETRLSLLNMTYKKYIEVGLCCFIPGKVLDELNQVLRVIDRCGECLPRAHDFLQELRDISSMAMEHFDEKVAPGLKFLGEKVSMNNDSESRISLFMHYRSGISLHTGNDRLALGIRRLQGTSNSLRSQMMIMYGKIEDQKKAINDQKNIINEQGIRIRNQGKKLLDLEKRLRITEQALSISGQEKKLAELENRLNSYNNLFNMIAQNQSASNTGLQACDSPIKGKLKRTFSDESLDDCTKKQKV